MPSKINRLTILESFRSTPGGKKIFKCLCDCGVIKNIRSDHVLSGRTSSCGCFGKEFTSLYFTTHGLVHTPEYKSWCCMKERCCNSNNKYYKHYGGRGIKICDRWIHSFENFLSDMGKKPSPNLSLDRINNNGNYEPSNCRWATDKEQMRNRSNTVFVTYNGITETAMEFSERFGINPKRIYKALKNGRSVEKFIA